MCQQAYTVERAHENNIVLGDKDFFLERPCDRHQQDLGHRDGGLVARHLKAGVDIIRPLKYVPTNFGLTKYSLTRYGLTKYGLKKYGLTKY